MQLLLYANVTALQAYTKDTGCTACNGYSSKSWRMAISNETILTSWRIQCISINEDFFVRASPKTPLSLS